MEAQKMMINIDSDSVISLIAMVIIVAIYAKKSR
jgi:hypothetical protein